MAFAKPVAIAQAKKGSKSTAALRRRRGKQWTLNFVARGPNRPLIARPVAALQLPKNGHLASRSIFIGRMTAVWTLLAYYFYFGIRVAAPFSPVALNHTFAVSTAE